MGILKVLNKILGFHGCQDNDAVYLGCDSMWIRRYIPTFRRNMQSSELKNKQLEILKRNQMQSFRTILFTHLNYCVACIIIIIIIIIIAVMKLIKITWIGHVAYMVRRQIYTKFWPENLVERRLERPERMQKDNIKTDLKKIRYK